MGGPGITVYDAVSGRARKKKRNSTEGDPQGQSNSGQPIAADDLLAASRSANVKEYLDYIRVYENEELPDSVSILEAWYRVRSNIRTC
jgi:hypothetical protein